MNSTWRRLAVVAAGSGIALGGTLLCIGLRHNAQSEFYLENGGLDYLYCVKIFTSWTLVGAAVGAAAFAVYEVLRRLVAKRGRSSA